MTYKTPPTKDVFKVKITDIQNDVLKTAILEQLKDVFRYMESDDLSFVKTEILKFCKNQEIKRAIMDSVSLLQQGNFDQIKSKIDFQNITKIVNGISIVLVIMVFVNITIFGITEIESYSTINYEIKKERLVSALFLWVVLMQLIQNNGSRFVF